ncbi:hypothetical protein VPH35_058002 [Triticum aestivum]
MTQPPILTETAPAIPSRALSLPPAQRPRRRALRQSGVRWKPEPGSSVATSGRQGEAWSCSLWSAMEAAREPAARRLPLPLASSSLRPHRFPPKARSGNMCGGRWRTRPHASPRHGGAEASFPCRFEIRTVVGQVTAPLRLGPGLGMCRWCEQSPSHPRFVDPYDSLSNLHRSVKNPPL